MTPTPNSTLYLLNNVELDPDYNYTIDFDNKEAQLNYFESKVSFQLEINEGYSFIRADEAVKVYANIDSLFGTNYLMFKNNDKWYFAFITKKEYVSESVTRLIFKIDVLQSFMFDYEIDESFVDREHQDRWKKVSGGGGIVANYSRTTETLEIGKSYKVKSVKNIESQDTNYNQGYYLIKASKPLGKYRTSQGWVQDELSTTHQDYETNNWALYSGTYLYIAPCRSFYGKIKEGNYTENYFEMPDKLFEDERVIEITYVKYLPTSYIELVEKGSSTFDDVFQFKYGYIAQYDQANSMGNNTVLARATGFPKSILTTTIENVPHASINDFDGSKAPNINLETKLMTYPYSYLRLQYGTETFDIFREQFFENFDEKISLYLSCGLNSRITISPINYNIESEDVNVFDAKQVTKPFDINLRTNQWLSYTLNNKASMNGGLIAGAVQTVASIGLGIATGGIGLAVAGGQALGFGGQIANELMKREDIKNRPDIMRPSLNDTLIDDAMTHLQLKVQNVEIYETFKNIAFKYFMHYGYKANEFKVPNLKSRYYYNYIKTIGANIKSNIDAEYKAEIMSIYDKGLTIWHFRNKSTFKGVNNYNFENVEMNILN